MKRIKHIHQNNSNDCGVACIAMIYNYYGRKESLSNIKKNVDVYIDGINGKTIINHFRNNGFNCVKKELNEKIHLPCIAITKQDEYYHFVVVYKITNKMIFICDPLKGKYKIPTNELSKKIMHYGIEILPSKKIERNKKEKSLVLNIFKNLFKKELKLSLLILFLSFLVTVFSLISIRYNNILLDKIIPLKNADKLTSVFLIYAILIVLRCIWSFFRKYFIFKYSKNIDETLLMGLYQKTIYLPYAYFTQKQTGDILSRFDDAVSVRETLSSISITLLMDFILSIGAGYLLYNMHHVLFFIAFIPLVVYTLSITLFKKIISKLNEETMQHTALLNATLVEMISQIELIKSYCIENEYISKIAYNFNKMMDKSLKIANTASLQITIQEMTKGLFTLAIMCMGSLYIINNQLTLGTLITYNSTVVYFLEPIEKVLQMQNIFQKSVLAINRLKEIIDIDNDFENKKADIDIENGDIKINNLSFSYRNDKLIFENLSFVIPKNKKVALIGKSGSGKTTFAKLLMRLYDIKNGNIFIGNVDISNVHKQSLRENISYVGQESFFFSGTILENINLKKKPIKEVIYICKLLEIHDFIISLPNKYNSMIYENGKNFSAGQKQRLSIARAVLSNPKILILDEATSNLDVNTELQIDKILNKLSKKITIIVIAHRLGTISRCEYIFFLQNGEIIESGTHDDLLSKKGEYFDLWNKREVIK